jgi:hypothetical protein
MTMGVPGKRALNSVELRPAKRPTFFGLGIA